MKHFLLAISVALTACNQASVTIEGLTFDSSIRTTPVHLCETSQIHYMQDVDLHPASAINITICT